MTNKDLEILNDGEVRNRGAGGFVCDVTNKGHLDIYEIQGFILMQEISVELGLVSILLDGVDNPNNLSLNNKPTLIVPCLLANIQNINKIVVNMLPNDVKEPMPTPSS